MRIKLYSMIVLILLAGLFYPAAAQAEADISISVSASGSWERMRDWNVTNAADIYELVVTEGKEASVTYLLEAYRYGVLELAHLAGDVCVTNNGSVPLSGFTGTVAVTDGTALITTANVDLATAVDIGPGEQACYPWSADISLWFQPDGAYYVEANLVSGESVFPTPAEPVIFPVEPPEVMYETIHVVGEDGRSWTFSESGSATYKKSFTCADAGSVWSSVEVVETGLVFGSGVEIYCSQCVQTVNYWKMHSSNGRKDFDETWNEIGEDTLFYQTGLTWLEMLYMPARGELYNKLAEQFIAAILNMKSGVYITMGMDNAMRNSGMILATYYDFPDDEWYQTSMPQLIRALKEFNQGKSGVERCGNPP